MEEKKTKQRKQNKTNYKIYKMFPISWVTYRAKCGFGTMNRSLNVTS